MVFFNRSSVIVSNDFTFSVAVNVTNVEFLSSGQFDVLYDKNILNVAANPSDGTINDTYNRLAYGNPATGCGWQSVGPVYSNGIDIGYGNATPSSGCLRILWTNDWVQTTSSGGDCAGGDGTGQCGDGWITVITFRAVGAGTCDIAFGAGSQGGKLQVNQIKDWSIYQDYSFDDTDAVWGPSVQVAVH
jgi:hypothetical protein